MTDKKFDQDVDAFVEHLKIAKMSAMQGKKSAIQREFMIARRWVDEAYRGYDASDIPVDLHRVERDLAVERDRQIDEACAGIEDHFNAGMRFLKHAGYEKQKKPRTDTVPDTAVETKNIRQEKVEKSISHQDIEKIKKINRKVDMIGLFNNIVYHLPNELPGLRIDQLHMSLSATGAVSDSDRITLKKLVQFLKEHGIIKTQGAKRGMRMFIPPSSNRKVDEIKALL